MPGVLPALGERREGKGLLRFPCVAWTRRASEIDRERQREKGWKRPALWIPLCLLGSSHAVGCGVVEGPGGSVGPALPCPIRALHGKIYFQQLESLQRTQRKKVSSIHPHIHRERGDIKGCLVKDGDYTLQYACSLTMNNMQ